MKRHFGTIACGAILAACADDSGPGSGAEGPSVAIDIAALSLQGVGDVVWDIEVVNGRTPTPDVVWRQRISSSVYGNSAGSTSYVGPCDASAGVAQNTVRLWVVGVYDGDVSAANAGPFAGGAATGVIGTALPFQNPTVTGPLTRTLTCSPNADAKVVFDVTLMRPAEQGFFDIAVNFDDLFCSAKYDCCYDATGDGCATDGSEDILLLHGPSGARERTHILGLSCTAGFESGVLTELYLDDLVLDCSAPATNFVPDITVSPAVAFDGNQCVVGTNGMSTCPAITEAPGVDADTYLYQVGVYRGDSLLPNAGGGDANLVYWNVALGVKGPIAGCRLKVRATADDANDPSDGVFAGTIGAGLVYPIIEFDVPLGACGSEPLSFGDPSAPVRPGYTSTTGASETFGHRFPDLVTSPVPFSFGSQTGAAAGAPTASGIQQVQGLAVPVPVSVSGQGDPQYRICSDATCSTNPPYTSLPGVVQPGQHVQVRLTAPTTPGATATGTLHLGDDTFPFSVTTAPAGPPPPPPGGTVVEGDACGNGAARGTIYQVWDFGFTFFAPQIVVDTTVPANQSFVVSVNGKSAVPDDFEVLIDGALAATIHIGLTPNQYFEYCWPASPSARHVQVRKITNTGGYAAVYTP